MIRQIHRGVLLALALAGTLGAGETPAPEEPPGSEGPVVPAPRHRGPPEKPVAPRVEDLGNQHYRIGRIQVDKAGHRFRVPGVVLRREPPLEFLVVASGGYKGYESLIEVGASAFEFNLACILIGLDPDHGKAPRQHFDPEAARGDPVSVQLTWKTGAEVRRVDAADLIEIDGKTLPRDQWVYTGSTFTPQGYFLAQIDGTLIGFVHDPASVIEHRTGSLGRFGDLQPSPALAPEKGTQVTLIVERREEPGERAGREPDE